MITNTTNTAANRHQPLPTPPPRTETIVSHQPGSTMTRSDPPHPGTHEPAVATAVPLDDEAPQYGQVTGVAKQQAKGKGSR